MVHQDFAKKSLGQHFLIDKNIARKIIENLRISEQDFIVEIGPGKGILTQFFLDKSVPVAAVEIDHHLVQHLQQQFHNHQQISIFHHDVLSFDFNLLSYGDRCVKWLGNLPYNISSPVLFLLLKHYPTVQTAVFMLQKEVAQRITASPNSKDFGILSVLLQTFYRVNYHFSVSKKVFRPKPKVDSAVISLEIRSGFQLNCAMSFYKRLVKQAFNQRRKVLSNSLATLFEKKAMDWIPFDFNRRAEQVPVKEWVELCQYLAQQKKPIQPRNG